MKTRPIPTLDRGPNQRLTSHNFKLGSTDREHLETIRGAFETAHGVSVSTSIILSLAIGGMMEEVKQGVLRVNREVSERLTRMAAPARLKEVHS